MLYLLKIGFQSFVLEDDKGISTIMRTLAKAREVDRDKRYCGGELTLTEKPVEVSLEAIPGLKFVSRKRERGPRRVFVHAQYLPPHPAANLPESRKLIPPKQLLLGQAN